MLPHFTSAFGNPHSKDHYAGWGAALAVDRAAQEVGGLIGAEPGEIIFTSGATEANNLALLGLARRSAGKSRRRILFGATEHKSILALKPILERQLGYRVELIPVDSLGRIQFSVLSEMISDDVLCIAAMAVNNEIGTIQDIHRISEIARQHGTHLHCDAAQAPEAIDLTDYSELVDSMSLSAHKMYGPMGVGALFIRRGIQSQIEPLIYGGGQQQGLRSGTVPVALCVGMASAARFYRSKDAHLSRERLRSLQSLFISRLSGAARAISLNGPVGLERHPGNINLRLHGFNGSDVLQVLQPKLAASTGAACTSGIPEPSHVLRAIGLTGVEAESSVRFGLGRGTTEAEIHEAVDLLLAAFVRLETSDNTDSVSRNQMSPSPSI
jgi:cysteine desulfurase